jgi:hypothetical protein
MKRKLELEKAKARAAHSVHARHMFRRTLADLWKDDRGEHAMEFLMILSLGVFPLIGAVFLLEDIFKEYVAFAQIFVSSPFF